MGCHTWFYSNQENLDKQLDCEYHDLFRYRNYDSGIVLKSLKETMDFIANKDNNCEVFNYTEQDLKEFWNKYPNGRIEFG